MKASFYERDITPPLGDFLVGSYASIFGTDVLDNLYCRCCCVENDGKIIAIVGIDSCEMPDDLHDSVTGRIKKMCGLEPECVMLTATHTHKGIPIESSPEISCFRDEAYTDVVYRIIADTVVIAVRRLKDADAVFGTGCAENISWNRTYITHEGRYATQPRDKTWKHLGGTDTSVPVLFIKDKDGRPMGAVVSFACHQDCTPGTAYSGAFAHVLADRMKQKYGNDFVTVYIPGASGDINHLDPLNYPPPEDFYVTMGNTLFDAVQTAVSSASPVNGTVDAVKKRITLKRRIFNKEQFDAEIKKLSSDTPVHPFKIRNLVYYQSTVHGEALPVYVQCIKIGNVAVYAYPGEIFVKFGKLLKEASPFENVLIGTLSNSGCGYVPTHEAYTPQSDMYESSLCYGACVVDGTGDLLNRELLSMANELKNRI